MASNKGSDRPGASRSKSSVSPAQRRRRQAAAAADSAARGPHERGRPGSGSGAQAHRHQAVPADAPRWTRDRILGWGAGLGALLALASLTAPALALFFGLLYAAVALLRPSDRQRTQLTVSTAAVALWVLLSTVVVVILVATSADGADGEQVQDVSLTGSYLALSLASGVLITLAVALVAIGFYTAGNRRYQLFTWSGLCLVAYYILFLPSAVGEASAPSTVGSLWTDPVSFGRIFFGIIAGLIMANAFWWRGGIGHGHEVTNEGRGVGSGDGDRSGVVDRRSGCRLALGEREYLLAIAAVLLLLSRLADFFFVDWASLRPADDQTTSEAVFQAAIFLAILLRLPVLFGAATFAFWTSARQSGWRPNSLLASASTGAETSVEIGAVNESTTARCAPISPALRLLLSWRLPLVLASLAVLVVATSLLGWYGFLVVVPATAAYLWMLTAKGQEPTKKE